MYPVFHKKASITRNGIVRDPVKGDKEKKEYEINLKKEII